MKLTQCEQKEYEFGRSICDRLNKHFKNDNDIMNAVKYNYLYETSYSDDKEVRKEAEIQIDNIVNNIENKVSGFLKDIIPEEYTWFVIAGIQHNHKYICVYFIKECDNLEMEITTYYYDGECYFEGNDEEHTSFFVIELNKTRCHEPTLNDAEKKHHVFGQNVCDMLNEHFKKDGEIRDADARYNFLWERFISNNQEDKSEVDNIKNNIEKKIDDFLKDILPCDYSWCVGVYISPEYKTTSIYIENNLLDCVTFEISTHVYHNIDGDENDCWQMFLGTNDEFPLFFVTKINGNRCYDVRLLKKVSRY